MNLKKQLETKIVPDYAKTVEEMITYNEESFIESATRWYEGDVKILYVTYYDTSRRPVDVPETFYDSYVPLNSNRSTNAPSQPKDYHIPYIILSVKL